MRSYFTPHFRRSYHKLPKAVQRAFDKQLAHLLKNIGHPSLRVKKFDEKKNIWQARITASFRAYFEIEENLYVFHEIKAHGD